MNTPAGKPLLAVTQGDVAGVGPETIVHAWADPELRAVADIVVVGHPEVMRGAARLFGDCVRVVEVESPAQAREISGQAGPPPLPCLPCGEDVVVDVPPGQIDPRAGAAAYAAVVRAARLALDGQVDGVTTAPLSKAALWRAGHHYPGHTELLAQLCGVDSFAMMLYLPPGDAVRGPAGLGVVHVTLHVALRTVADSINTVAIVDKCRLADRAMRDLGAATPRIGVCALNPHAGEEGLFGDEEQRIIAPAVAAARSEGWNVSGPLPADALLAAGRDGTYDAIVAMYHDQGHIALKLLGMHRAVNITLGLPIVRTSAAHGTAFDLAWQGRADWGGMAAALRVAAQLAKRAAAHDELPLA
jgi:4-hydroxythreonine-4-phosphate dehydrogenase